MVADGGAVFLFAVVVDHHCAAAEVALGTHVAVANVGQVADLGAVADGGVLQLYKIPHLHVLSHMAVGADIGKGPHMGAGVDGGLIALGGVDHRAIPHGAVGEHGVGADLTVFSNHCVSPQDGAG